MSLWLSVMALSVGILFGSVGPANAQQPSTQRDQETRSRQSMTPEMREQMAKMHEEMAACLRAGKDMQDCHNQMMKNCPMMNDGQCPMMGMMHGHHGESKMKGKKRAKRESPEQW